MRDGGSKVCSMEMARSAGKTVDTTMVNSKMDLDKERESSSPQTTRFTRVSSFVITWKDMESIRGQMVVVFKVNGKITKCMGKEFLPGPMVGYIRGIIVMMRNKDTGFLYGPMGRSTMVVGKMGNNMDMVILHLPQVRRKKQNEENGKKENVFDG